MLRARILNGVSRRGFLGPPGLDVRTPFCRVPVLKCQPVSHGLGFYALVKISSRLGPSSCRQRRLGGDGRSRTPISGLGLYAPQHSSARIAVLASRNYREASNVLPGPRCPLLVRERLLSVRCSLRIFRDTYFSRSVSVSGEDYSALG